ncbi:MAG: hypothetical protein H6970_16055 [Gammaproteobacteria bacterium]|nr:hypothetical protein [Gammaproteobacteria bacterium]MCP5426560.1 hypothetical protein [Gammaproteobacteria bacterium]MCP5458735.1 hypothetical protein [Gammaproteobacteria bacterium]MCP5460082.1 hypothetical protein [Gammaproteobacteria bacterium]
MPTAVTMLEAFRENFPGLTLWLTAMAYLIGMWAGGSAILLLYRRERDASVTWGAVLARLVLGATGLYLPTAISSGQETLFGVSTILSYSAGSAVSSHGKIVLDTVLKFVQLVGLWAFIWGFVLLNRAHARGYDAALGSKAVMHIIGGILCMNVVASLQVLAATLGLEKLLSYLLTPA